MSVLPDFVLHRPTSIGEAVGVMSFDDVAYAGGTELLLAMKAGLLRPRSLIDLKSITALAEVRNESEMTRIGGSVTHQSAVDHPDISRDQPGLAEVLAHVGNPRVRAAGTLGGNLCFAEPKSDVATILLALEASVALEDAQGSRVIPISDFILGPYTTAKEPDELLVAILIPGREGRRSSYAKFQTMERPTVGVAVAIISTGRCRVVVGAVGGSPEAFEFDRPSDVDAGAIAAGVEVIPDLTGSEPYKRHLVSQYVDRAVAMLGSEQ